MRRDLGKVVERTNGDEAIGKRGKWPNVRTILGRLKTGKTFWQTQQLFRVQFIGRANRVGKRVRNSVIHGRQTSGVWISNPSHLNRRGLANEHAHSVERSVSRKVHKNVNAVRLNHARQIFVVQFVHLAPVSNHRLHARGGFIRVKIVAVAKHVKFIFVMRGQNWFYELSHGVAVEIG